MKITKQQLIQLIKEELEATLQEQDDLDESLQGKGLPEHISECIGNDILCLPQAVAAFASGGLEQVMKLECVQAVKGCIEKKNPQRGFGRY